MLVISISYPSSETKITLSKSDVLTALMFVWDVNWFICLAKPDKSSESTLAVIETLSVLLPFKLKLNVPLPDLLKGPRAKIVLADATTPVPTKFSLSLFAV